MLEHRQPEAADVILGPLIVFETLAGLLYTFLLRQSLPRC
ncbi:Inner membrane protein ytfF [Raoultella terrigena]|uniref:Inner membrane protein ytfF n=1 Tax=Raoultella terrigena TaxID=577 RepID=A0A4U9DAZ5_RAOTE|nr:Inner membrane protein ytfF [Raoultella terrigena]